MQCVAPDSCLLLDACKVGSSAACIPATLAAWLLLLAVLLGSSSCTEDEEEEAAGWLRFCASGEAEEEGVCDAGGEEKRPASMSGGPETEAVLSLLLLARLLASGFRATAELDRSMARSSSCRSPCQCSWNRVIRSREMSSSSSLSPPPAGIARMSACRS